MEVVWRLFADAVSVVGKGADAHIMGKGGTVVDEFEDVVGLHWSVIKLSHNIWIKLRRMKYIKKY